MRLAVRRAPLGHVRHVLVLKDLKGLGTQGPTQGYCRLTATLPATPALHLTPAKRPGSLRLVLIAGGVAIGIVAIVVVVRQEDFGLESLLFLVVGWAFIASGIAGWLRRPENRTGALMIAVGAMWFGARCSRALGSSPRCPRASGSGHLAAAAGGPARRLSRRADQTRAERGALIA